jgi:hypothetical protein
VVANDGRTLCVNCGTINVALLTEGTWWARQLSGVTINGADVSSLNLARCAAAEKESAKFSNTIRSCSLHEWHVEVAFL